MFFVVSHSRLSTNYKILSTNVMIGLFFLSKVAHRKKINVVLKPARNRSGFFAENLK